MNIIETISNEDFCTDIVHEYFGGKFTREETRKLLYEMNPVGNLTVRKGVEKLAEEWNKLNDHSQKSVEEWYSTTDFYIFDLLPWNACSMFTDKLEPIIQRLEHYGVQKMVDYGAGLGITSLYVKERIPEMDITYVDFQSSHQFKFSRFLMQKLGIDTIPAKDVSEFMNGNDWYHAVVAMDCFEHIPNMDETLSAITRQTNIVIHDSTFFRNEVQPQHINNFGDKWFINLMLKYGFFFEGDIRAMRRFKLSFDGNGLKMDFSGREKDIYGA